MKKVICKYWKTCERHYCGAIREHWDTSCEPCPFVKDAECIPVVESKLITRLQLLRGPQAKVVQAEVHLFGPGTYNEQHLVHYFLKGKRAGTTPIPTGTAPLAIRGVLREYAKNFADSKGLRHIREYVKVEPCGDDAFPEPYSPHPLNHLDER